jgi:hypothetical protein
MTDLITLYTPELLKAFVTLTALLFGANILQAIAAISRKGQGQDTILELHHAYKDLSKAIAERDKAKAEPQRANHLRDECEKTMRAAMEENDRMMIKEKELTNICDDLFDTLCDAVEKMPVPFHLRQRDERGKFAKTDAFTVATNLFLKKAVGAMELRNSKGQIAKLHP